MMLHSRHHQKGDEPQVINLTEIERLSIVPQYPA